MKPKLFFPFPQNNYNLIGFGKANKSIGFSSDWIEKRPHYEKQICSRAIFGDIQTKVDDNYLIYFCPISVEVLEEWNEVVQREIREEGKVYQAEKKEHRVEVLLPPTPLYESFSWTGSQSDWVIDPSQVSFMKVIPCEAKVYVSLVHVEFEILD